MAGGLVAGLLAAACWLLLLPAQRGGRRVPAPRRRAGGPRSPDPDALRSTGVSDPALMLDLVAAMLDAGQPLLPALGVLAEVVDSDTALRLRRVQAALELGAPWPVAWELATAGPVRATAAGLPPSAKRRRRGSLRSKAPADHLREALTFVATTGAPSAAVLLAEAAQLRRRRSREAERRAAALGVRLVVPLGLCALPAFLVLTVVPLLLSLLPSFP